MKDVFYTILVVWLVWRILAAINSSRSKTSGPKQNSSKKEGQTTVNYVPPKKNHVVNSNKIEAEDVDFEVMD